MKQQLQKQIEHDRTSICIILNLIRQSLTLKPVNSQSQNPTKTMYPTDLLHRTARNRMEQVGTASSKITADDKDCTFNLCRYLVYNMFVCIPFSQITQHLKCSSLQKSKVASRGNMCFTQRVKCRASLHCRRKKLESWQGEQHGVMKQLTPRR